MVEHPAVKRRGERSKRPFAGGIADGSQRSYAAPEMVRIHFAEPFLFFGIIKDYISHGLVKLNHGFLVLK
jgi:hypothetical protein